MGNSFLDICKDMDYTAVNDEAVQDSEDCQLSAESKTELQQEFLSPGLPITDGKTPELETYDGSVSRVKTWRLQTNSWRLYIR